jgi:hypothetical protein
MSDNLQAEAQGVQQTQNESMIVSYAAINAVIKVIAEMMAKLNKQIQEDTITIRVGARNVWPVKDGQEFDERLAKKLIDGLTNPEFKGAIKVYAEVDGEKMDLFRMSPQGVVLADVGNFRDEVRKAIESVGRKVDEPEEGDRSPKLNDDQLQWMAIAQSLPAPANEKYLDLHQKIQNSDYAGLVEIDPKILRVLDRRIVNELRESRLGSRELGAILTGSPLSNVIPSKEFAAHRKEMAQYFHQEKYMDLMSIYLDKNPQIERNEFDTYPKLVEFADRNPEQSKEIDRLIAREAQEVGLGEAEIDKVLEASPYSITHMNLDAIEVRRHIEGIMSEIQGEPIGKDLESEIAVAQANQDSLTHAVQAVNQATGSPEGQHRTINSHEGSSLPHDLAQIFEQQNQYLQAQLMTTQQQLASITEQVKYLTRVMGESTKEPDMKQWIERASDAFNVQRESLSDRLRIGAQKLGEAAWRGIQRFCLQANALDRAINQVLERVSPEPDADGLRAYRTGNISMSKDANENLSISLKDPDGSSRLVYDRGVLTDDYRPSDLKELSTIPTRADAFAKAFDQNKAIAERSVGNLQPKVADRQPAKAIAR